MVRRILTLLFLFFVANAQALPRGSGTQPSSCIFTGSTTNGSCIQQTDGTGFLTNVAVGHSAQYGANDLGLCGSSKNCLYIYLTPTPTGHRTAWVQFGFSNEAVLCTTRGQIDAQTTSGFGNLWWETFDTRGSLQQWYQVSSSCASPKSPFINTTRNARYNGIADMCLAAASGDSLSVPVMPSGIPYWDGSQQGHQGGCDLTASGVTLNIASGAKLYESFCEGGAGGICLHAANLTISGAGATIGYNNITDKIIDVLHDNANPIIRGSLGAPLVIDCQGLYGQPIAGNAPQGILTGGHTGMVTLSHLQVKNCGSVGTEHPVYLSWGGNTAPDRKYCYSINDLYVQDATGDTPAIKLDATCQTTPGKAKNITVTCTIAGIGNPNGNCDQNEPIDMQCGGVHNISNSIFEMYGQTPTSDQWIFNKANWGDTRPDLGCPTALATSNSVHFDRDVFILDGYSAFAEGIGGHTYVSCGSNNTGSGSTAACNANMPGHTAVCITNSQIIEDTINYSARNKLIPGNGVFTDAACTTSSGIDSNTYYQGQTGTGSAGRLMACSASNWMSGSGTNCAFPFVPTFLTEIEDHDTIVAEARAAGFCGAGTSDDPIRGCTSVEKFIAALDVLVRS